jgi:outer membrane protein assembly factor BamB
MVFVGSLSDHQLHAFDAATGVQRWFLQALGAVGSPLVIGSTVYAATNDGELYALRASDGTLRWKVTFNGGLNNGLAAHGGYLFAGDAVGCTVRAFSLRTGALKWSTCVNEQVFSTPAVAGGKVFVSARNGNVYALDEQTGAILWTGSTGTDNFSSAAAAYGMIFIGSTDDNVYAFPQNCAATCLPTWTFKTGAEIVEASPVVANGVLYIDTNQVYALDARTGALLWSYATGVGGNDAPALVDGMLYVGDFDHNLYAFSLPSGP